MASYYLVLCLHLVGATIWAGGHIVLAVSVLPRALREKRAVIVSDYESAFERVGLPALAAQVATGLWLAHHLLGAPDHWFDSTPIARVVQVKLGLLALTVALAVHARFRVIPKLHDGTLPTLAWHIRIVTAAAVLFVLAGASIRVGGYPVFDR
ncbi:MAG: CopD family protein [Acidimicrobiia bacterium]